MYRVTSQMAKKKETAQQHTDTNSQMIINMIEMKQTTNTQKQYTKRTKQKETSSKPRKLSIIWHKNDRD